MGAAVVPRVRLVSPFVLLAALVSTCDAAQSSMPTPALSAAQRHVLVEASGDPLLPEWQREFMVQLARVPADASPAGPVPPGPAPTQRVGLGSTDGVWSEPSPAPAERSGHTAIYDPVRDRMVVFGGQGRNDAWALSLAESPAWTELEPTGTPPSRRVGHTAGYDPMRDRMVVFGGYEGGAVLNDVWALSLAESPAWTEIAPAGPPPSKRYGHTMVYDPLRDRMVVFGGDGLNDVWALSLADSSAWTKLAPAGPLPSLRANHTALYDPLRDRMVVFGGFRTVCFGHGCSSVYSNEVWALSLTGSPAWTGLVPAGTSPSRRVGHTAVYDPMRDRMVVFGGHGEGAVLNDVWALSLSAGPAWTELAPTGGPPSNRSGHTAVHDPVRDRLIMFGGGDTEGRNDTWSMSLAGGPAWSPLAPAGIIPVGRRVHTAVYDPVRDQMVVFGGFNWAYLNDAWALSLTGSPTWSQLTPGGIPPSGRYHPAAIHDPVRDRVLVFGGFRQVCSGSNCSFYYYDDVWALSLAGSPAWSQLAPAGTAPSGRYGHTAVYDPIRDRMVVFGGLDASFYPGNVRGDVWELSLTGSPTWSELAPTGTPPGRRMGHTAVYDPERDRMLVFGGDAGGSEPFYNDIWMLSLAGSPTWTELVPAGSRPSARAYLTSVYDPVRDRLVALGGYTGFSRLNDSWALSLGGSLVWTQLSPAGSPPNGRFGHTAVYDPVRDRMVVFGGMDESSYRNDVWMLSWESPVPALISLVSAEAEAGRVSLTWFAHDGITFLASVERRTADDGWRRIGSVTPDGGGYITFEDRDVTAGIRYAYRLAYTVDGGERTTPEVWVDIPVRAVFALDGLWPNPAVDDLVVSFSLPSAEPATLEVFDVAGRRLVAREVGSLGPGRQRWNLSRGVYLSAGTYSLRLTQGDRRAVVRAVILR